MTNKLKFEYYSVAEVFQLLSEDYDITQTELIKYIQLGKLQTNVRVNGTWNVITQVSNKKLTKPIEFVSYPSSGFITYSQNNVKVHSAIAVNLENNYTIINLKSSDFFNEYNLYDGQDIPIKKPDKQVCLSDMVMTFKGVFKLPYQLYDGTLIDDNKFVIDFSCNELSQIKSNTNDDLSICLTIDRAKLTHENKELILTIDNLIVIKNDLSHFIENIIKRNHIVIENNANTPENKQNIQSLKKEIDELKIKIKELQKIAAESPTKKMLIFLKSVLYIHFGQEITDSPRKHIYDKSSGSGKDGMIQKSFDKKGLHLNISGKTLESWLKNIEIPFTKK